jgi:hypothetical protein
MVGAYHSWDGMMLSCVRLECQGFEPVLMAVLLEHEKKVEQAVKILEERRAGK